MESSRGLFDEDDYEVAGDLPEYGLGIDEWSVTDHEEENGEQSEDGSHSISSNEDPRATKPGGTIFCAAELEILKNARPEWLRLSGTVRGDHVYQICQQLALLDDVQDYSDDEWVVRVGVSSSLRVFGGVSYIQFPQQYKRWFWNQARTLHKDKRIRVGHAWNIRSVIKQKYKREILATIREKYRFVHGSHDELRVYQSEATLFIQTLTADQIAEAEDLAEEWTIGEGPPLDVKAKYKPHDYRH